MFKLIGVLVLLCAQVCGAITVPFKKEGVNEIGYLTIGRDHPIDQSTYLYVKFALEEFKKKQVPFVVLDLNTPGGEVFASMKIADLLQKLDTHDHIPVVAVIDNWAISAGAMLAYSCRWIVVTRNGSMGAAEPVYASQEGGMQSAPEKINSALRAEFANLARFYGRNPAIAEAMVDKDIILVKRGKEIIRLDETSQIRPNDRVISGKGKLLTLTAEQLIEYGVADEMLPSVPLTPITEEEKALGRFPAYKYPLFVDPDFPNIPNAVLIAYSDWRISFFAFLSYPVIASLLYMGLVGGIYLEIKMPGTFLPAAMAGICLILILLSAFAIDAAPLFPRLDDVHFSFDFSALNEATIAFMKGLAWLLGSTMLSLLIVWLITRYLLKPHLVLRGEQNASEGFVAGPDLATLPKIGTIGIAHTSFRPAGKIAIDGQIYEAMADGKFIEEGKTIQVIRYDGNRMIVRSH
jgi:membrane-bound serine protease (ClpP class)